MYPEQPPPESWASDVGDPGSPAPPHKRRSLLPFILGGIAALVVIAVGAMGMLTFVRPRDATPGANSAPTPTISPLFTATPFTGSVVFSDALPGRCGDNPYQWATDTNGASITCANGVMTLAHPATDGYVSQEYFQPPSYTFPSRYEVSVTVANVIGGCAGMEVLGNQHRGYTLYMCSDGEWTLTMYDDSGVPKMLDGNIFGRGSHTLTMAITPGRLDLSIDGRPVSTTQSTYDTTEYIALACDDGSQTGSADFSNFTLTA